MSNLFTMPEFLQNAASDLAGIGSAIRSANAMAAAPTTGVLAAGTDEVSVAVTSLFSTHATTYQQVSSLVEDFHARFVQALIGAGQTYAAAEAANVLPLQSLGQGMGNSAAAAQATLANYGYGNVGQGNFGFFNTGTLNFGIGNVSPNFTPTNPISQFGGFGLFNTGIDNVGAFNSGSVNIGIGNVSPNFTPGNPLTQFGSLGMFNNGIDNVGIGNVGVNNQGLPVPLLSLLGVGNHGTFNQGLFNTGNYNTGIGLVGDHLIGIGPLHVSD
ncbi:PE family protein [Mycobacterium servetii]|uniref:PE family protein n=1 Tax=Mycobacterium servetii TaxID=3237418 RepID=A0ABV4BV13_9MYCO